MAYVYLGNCYTYTFSSQGIVTPIFITGNCYTYTFPSQGIVTPILQAYSLLESEGGSFHRKADPKTSWGSGGAQRGPGQSPGKNWHFTTSITDFEYFGHNNGKQFIKDWLVAAARDRFLSCSLCSLLHYCYASFLAHMRIKKRGVEVPHWTPD